MALLKKHITASEIDLRGYTPEALAKIKKITATSVILPKKTSPEFLEAYSDISKNISSVIRLEQDECLHKINGNAVLDNSKASENTIYKINGNAFIKNTDSTLPMRIYANGNLFYEKGAGAEIIKANGNVTEICYKYIDVKIFSSKQSAGKKFFDNIKNGTLIFITGNFTVENNVLPEDLEKKDLHFIIAGTLICGENIKDIIMAMSDITGKIITDGQE